MPVGCRTARDAAVAARRRRCTLRKKAKMAGSYLEKFVDSAVPDADVPASGCHCRPDGRALAGPARNRAGTPGAHTDGFGPDLPGHRPGMTGAASALPRSVASP